MKSSENYTFSYPKKLCGENVEWKAESEKVHLMR